MNHHTQVVEAFRLLARKHRVSTWTAPADAAGHRQRILAGLREARSDYDERFVYEPVDAEAYDQDAAALGVWIVGRVEERLVPVLLNRLTGLRSWARSVGACDDQVFSEEAVLRDGVPSQLDLDLATEILASDPTGGHEDSSADVEAADLAGRFHSFLSDHGLDGWRVELHPNMAAKASVNGVLRRVRLRSGTRFTEDEAARLLVHEVGGHVLRWHNAEMQPEPLAVLPLGHSLLAEEGLAVWLEQHHGVQVPRILRTYAARAVAVSLAQTSGIMEVAHSLAPIIGETGAAEIAFRVKRGLRNPNRPGGLTKDWVYLGGLQAVRALAERSQEDLMILQVVKWGLDCLPLARELLSEGRLELAPSSTDARLIRAPGTFGGISTGQAAGL